MTRLEEQLQVLLTRWRADVVNTGDAVHDNATEGARRGCADDLEAVINELPDPDYGDPDYLD